MAKWQFDGAAARDYPTLGFQAAPGNILEADNAPDASWSSADAGAAETVTRYNSTGVVPAFYTEPTDGAPLLWDDASNTYQPATTALSATYVPFPEADRRQWENISRGGDLRAMTSPPTVTISAANPASSRITSGVYVDKFTSLVQQGGTQTNWMGGTPVIVAAAAEYVGNKTTTSTLDGGQPVTVEFMHDGSQIEFRLLSASSVQSFRIKVDGLYVSTTPTALTGDSNTYNWLVDFAGARKVRHIQIEMAPAAWRGMYVGPNDTVWPPVRPNSRRVVFLGDSFTVGANATKYLYNYALYVARLCGWDEAILSGQAGTGYLNPGSGGGRTKFADRITPDVVPFDPETVVIFGSTNDVSYGGPAVQAAAASLYADLATKLPDARVIVVGCQYPSGAADTARDAINDALAAACAAAPNVEAFISPKGWITGTGKQGATTGTGNADLYIHSDGLHPTDAGHAYYGQRIARAIFAAGIGL